MEPKDLEKELQKHSPSINKKLLALCKCRDKPLALRAIKLYYARAYGEAAKTDYDPFKGDKTPDELVEMIKETMKEEDKNDE